MQDRTDIVIFIYKVINKPETILKFKSRSSNLLMQTINSMGLSLESHAPCAEKGYTSMAYSLSQKNNMDDFPVPPCAENR